MIGVRKCPGDKVPSMSIVKSLDVHEDPEQFDDGQGRVSVIELDSHLLGQLVPVDCLPPLEPSNQVMHAGRYEQILLFQPKLFASIRVVIRV